MSQSPKPTPPPPPPPPGKKKFLPFLKSLNYIFKFVGKSSIFIFEIIINDVKL